MSLSLISINIEKDKHLDTVLDFLKANNADVTCLQELFEKDVPLFEALGYSVDLLPMTKYRAGDGSLTTFNLGLCTKLPSRDHIKFYYYQPSTELPLYESKDSTWEVWHGILGATIMKNEIPYTICTTHFTWSEAGATSTLQLETFEVLKEKVAQVKPHILCGDFNVPRGTHDVYTKLTTLYKDNIPPQHKTSLDPVLHRANSDPVESARIATYVVDYLFTKPEYVAHDVKLHFGISDHAAITATIEKI